MPPDQLSLDAFQTVSAADLRRNFGVWQARASAAPLAVARHGRPRLVLASVEHYLALAQGRPTGRTCSAMAAIPEHSSEALLVLDRDLRILAVNRLFEDMVGSPAARLVGQAWAELFPDAARTVIADQMRHVLRTGAAVRFEAPAIQANGRRYDFSLFAHEHGVAALIVDRTVEAELREQIEEYRSLVSSFAVVPDAGYVRVNLRGFIEAASPQVPRLLGFDPAERPHRLLTDLLCADARIEALERLDEVLTGGRPARFPVAMMNAAGEAVAVKLALAPIWRGATPAGAMAFFHLV